MPLPKSEDGAKYLLRGEVKSFNLFPGGEKSWEVVNPETLKDHVGHHVELSAHVYADKARLHVMKVTMLKQ